MVTSPVSRQQLFGPPLSVDCGLGVEGWGLFFIHKLSGHMKCLVTHVKDLEDTQPCTGTETDPKIPFRHFQ